MATQEEIHSFHQFALALLHDDGETLTMDQIYQLWRERDATIESIRRGINDVDHGRTRPADEVLHEVRQELHNR